jgi:hypothetical protein
MKFKLTVCATLGMLALVGCGMQRNSHVKDATQDSIFLTLETISCVSSIQPPQEGVTSKYLVTVHDGFDLDTCAQEIIQKIPSLKLNNRFENLRVLSFERSIETDSIYSQLKAISCVGSIQPPQEGLTTSYSVTVRDGMDLSACANEISQKIPTLVLANKFEQLRVLTFGISQ